MSEENGIQNTIEYKLGAAIAGILHLEVINESHRHNVPTGSESHFKIVVVSEAFDGVRLLERHRRINEILAAELAGAVHALAIHVYTPAEWRSRMGDAPLSPPCLGGGRGAAARS